jgi:hypothetical protein
METGREQNNLNPEKIFMVTINEIDKFFETHPLKTEYFVFSELERAGVILIARRDIQAALDYAEIPEQYQEFFTAAVAEQSIYMLLNPAALTGSRDNIARENSAGNSRSYRESDTPLCVRTAALLAPIKKYLADQNPQIPGGQVSQRVSVSLTRG